MHSLLEVVFAVPFRFLDSKLAAAEATVSLTFFLDPLSVAPVVGYHHHRQA